MYADRLAAGSKRSAVERINSSADEDYGRSRQITGKRQRQSDDKWKHDLYEDGSPQISNLKIGPKDLRLKLHRKGLQQTRQVGKVSVKAVRDLRERLSGTMHSQPANSDTPKPRVITEVTKLVKKSNSVDVRDVLVPNVKEAPKSLVSKSVQPKDADTNLLLCTPKKKKETRKREQVRWFTWRETRSLIVFSRETGPPLDLIQIQNLPTFSIQKDA